MCHSVACMDNNITGIVPWISLYLARARIISKGRCTLLSSPLLDLLVVPEDSPRVSVLSIYPVCHAPVRPAAALSLSTKVRRRLVGGHGEGGGTAAPAPPVAAANVTISSQRGQGDRRGGWGRGRGGPDRPKGDESPAGHWVLSFAQLSFAAP